MKAVHPAGLAPTPRSDHPAAGIRLRVVAPVLATATLMTACAFPYKESPQMPGPEVIRMSSEGGRLQALPPDCETLYQPSRHGTPHDVRMGVSFGCATYTNLSQQIARPEDLVAPRPYGRQSAETATAAVRRHQTGKTTPLRQTTTTSGDSK